MEAARRRYKVCNNHFSHHCISLGEKGIVYQVIIKKNYNMIFMYINELKNYISGFKGEST